MALKYRKNEDDIGTITVSVKRDRNNSNDALIEWSGIEQIDHDPFHSFAGSDEIRLSLAAKIVEAHGGSAQYEDHRFRVTLPLAQEA